MTRNASTEIPLQTIRIIASDPDLYAYLEDCTSRIPGMHVLPDGTARPDLLVTDVYDPVLPADANLAGVPRLYVLDEPPIVGKLEPIEFILTPFDSRSIAHAVLRALRQPRGHS